MSNMPEPARNSLTSPSATHARWPFILICCSPLIAIRVWIWFAHPQLYDFFTYWAAGRLFLTGGHPYSAAATLAIQRSLGWTNAAPMMTFCPPWGLPFLAVMAYPPFRAAQMAWFAVSLLLNGLSAVGLWHYFGGEKGKAWIALLVCATFIPMASAELMGQITPVLLASLTAFLLLLRSQRHFLAGVVLLGLGFKPHLLYLLFLAIVLWVLQQRAWKVLLGAALAYGTAAAAAFALNPNSADYLRHTVGAAIETSSGVGGALRSLFGMQHQWLQFLPCLFGAAWFFPYWIKHRRSWDWQIHLPLLLVISVASSPYCWYHDFILILPALIWLAVHGACRSVDALAAYFGVQAIIILAFGLSAAWMCAASLLWIVFYFVARAATNRPAAATPSVAVVLP